MVHAIDQLACELRLFVPSEISEAAVQQLGIVAAVEFVGMVVRRDVGQSERHLRIGHQIAPADLDTIDAQILRHQVDQPLTKKVSFEAAGTAIGTARSLVGHQHRRGDIDVLDAIRPRRELRDIPRRDGPVGSQIRAVIGVGTAAQSENAAVPRGSNLQFALRLPGVVRGHQVFPAILDPPDGTSHMTGGERDQEVFRIEFTTAAEPAADIDLDHLDLGFVESHRVSENTAVGPGDLGDAPHGHALGSRIPFRDEAARFP